MGNSKHQILLCFYYIFYSGTFQSPQKVDPISSDIPGLRYIFQSSMLFLLGKPDYWNQWMTWVYLCNCSFATKGFDNFSNTSTFSRTFGTSFGMKKKNYTPMQCIGRSKTCIYSMLPSNVADNSNKSNFDLQWYFWNHK